MLTVWTAVQVVVAALAALVVWVLVAGIVMTWLEKRKGRPDRHHGGHRRTTPHHHVL